jgi:hypothetical protein
MKINMFLKLIRKGLNAVFVIYTLKIPNKLWFVKENVNYYFTLNVFLKTTKI